MKTRAVVTLLFFTLCSTLFLCTARGQQPRPGTTPEAAKVDLNSANEHELMNLTDITFPQVRKIIANRPYRETHELVSKKIVTEETFAKIRDKITVKPAR
jgi:DNA uptake protein ComE-like DNA-binding protein